MAKKYHSKQPWSHEYEEKAPHREGAKRKNSFHSSRSLNSPRYPFGYKVEHHGVGLSAHKPLKEKAACLVQDPV